MINFFFRFADIQPILNRSCFALPGDGPSHIWRQTYTDKDFCFVPDPCQVQLCWRQIPLDWARSSPFASHRTGSEIETCSNLPSHATRYNYHHALILRIIMDDPIHFTVFLLQRSSFGFILNQLVARTTRCLSTTSYSCSIPSTSRIWGPSPNRWVEE